MEKINYNFKTTYRLKFMIYSTLEVKSLNGTVIELGDPLLNIGDRYIDLSFKGVTGADISYGEVPNPLDGITKFFQDLVSTGWGIVLAVLMLVAMIALVYVLIRYLIPLIIRKIADKSRKSKPKPIQPTQNRRINRKYI
jgi:hypothetical protein